MKLLVLVALLGVLVNARPEGGYSYSTSSGAPGGGGGFSNDAVSGGDGSGFEGSVGGGALIQTQIYAQNSITEPEEVPPQRTIQAAAAPRKHYEAPTPTSPTLPAEDEQKPLIYMLVKKPKGGPEITIPTRASSQPSKPETFFTCYMTQKEVRGIGIGGVTGISDRFRFARQTGGASGNGIDTKVNAGRGGAPTTTSTTTSTPTPP